MKKVTLLWKKWKAFGQKIADFQGRILLTLFYFLFILPLGLVIKPLTDPLKTKSKVEWENWTLKSESLEDSKNQF